MKVYHFFLNTNEFEIVNESYKENDFYAVIKHNQCDRNFFQKIKKIDGKNLIIVNSCPYCNNETINSTDGFNKYLENKLGKDYELEGEFIDWTKPITIRHIKCGSKYVLKTPFFMRHYISNCNYCINNDIKNKFFSLCEKREYTIKEEYKSQFEKIKIEHNCCKTVVNIEPNKFIQKEGLVCPICKKNIKKFEEFFKKMNETHCINNYNILEMNSVTGNISLEHKICGEIIHLNNNRIIKNFIKHGCPFCLTKKYKSLISRRFNIKDNTVITSPYDKIDAYDKRTKRMRLEVPDKLAKLSPFDSDHEYEIAKILNKHNIKYIYQWTSSECKNINELRFDFALFRNLSEVPVCIIEYDGEQHYYPVDVYNGEEGFKYIQNNDRIKNTYCVNNNIPLYRISSIKGEKNLKEEIKKIIIENFPEHELSKNSYIIAGKVIENEYLPTLDRLHNLYYEKYNSVIALEQNKIKYFLLEVNNEIKILIPTRYGAVICKTNINENELLWGEGYADGNNSFIGLEYGAEYISYEDYQKLITNIQFAYKKDINTYKTVIVYKCDGKVLSLILKNTECFIDAIYNGSDSY